MTDLDQIDREVAEKVMGWMKWDTTDYESLWCRPNGDRSGFCVGAGDSFNERWHPTRNIEQAFLVVEKMRELGWTFLIECNEVGFWNAVFAKDDIIKSAQYDDLPEAICRASLKAITEPTP